MSKTIQFTDQEKKMLSRFAEGQGARLTREIERLKELQEQFSDVTNLGRILADVGEDGKVKLEENQAKALGRILDQLPHGRVKGVAKQL